MAINSKELQKFLDLWGPMINSLPTVINAIEREEELTRHVAILETRRAAALAGLEADAVDLKSKCASITAEIAELTKTKKATTAMVKEHKASCELAIADADATLEKTIAEKQAVAQARIQEVAVEVAEAESLVTVAKEKAKVSLAEIDADIQALQAKRTQAEKALATLRAKLG